MLRSFTTMKRLASVLILVTLSLGCATARPEQVNGKDLSQQLEDYIDAYYDQVVGLCIELQGKANTRQSGVGCAVRSNAMHVTFPNRAYHQAHVVEVAQLYNHWCAAYGSKTGKPGIWVRYFRDDKTHETVVCQRKKAS